MEKTNLRDHIKKAIYSPNEDAVCRVLFNEFKIKGASKDKLKFEVSFPPLIIDFKGVSF
jgi:hypothetical protein